MNSSGLYFYIVGLNDLKGLLELKMLYESKNSSRIWGCEGEKSSLYYNTAKPRKKPEHTQTSPSSSKQPTLQDRLTKRLF